MSGNKNSIIQRAREGPRIAALLGALASAALVTLIGLWVTNNAQATSVPGISVTDNNMVMTVAPEKTLVEQVIANQIADVNMVAVATNTSESATTIDTETEAAINQETTVKADSETVSGYITESATTVTTSANGNNQEVQGDVICFTAANLAGANLFSNTA